LELSGDGNLARQALNFFRIVQFHSVDASRHQLVLHVQSQEDVDRLVDQLRRASLSIVNLSRRRATLEDAFLGIVQAAAPD
jgi:hypothetical protein